MHHASRITFHVSRFTFHALLLSFYFLLVSCSSTLDTPAPHAQQKFVIVAPESFHALISELTDAYHRTHSYISFELRDANSSAALAALTRGEANLVLVARAPRADELERAKAEPIELGRDAISVIVNPANSLTNLSRDQVTKIFAGDIHFWTDVQAKLPQGASPVIAVVSREEGSGTRQVFETLLLPGRRVTLTALLQPSERDVSDYVAAQPDAIGYLSFNALSPRVKTLTLDTIVPALENIANGKYALTRSLYLVAPTRPSPDLDDLIAYLQSAEAKKLSGKYLVVK